MRIDGCFFLLGHPVPGDVSTTIAYHFHSGNILLNQTKSYELWEGHVLISAH